MKIKKEFSSYNKINSFLSKYYTVSITVEDEEGNQKSIFIDTTTLCEPKTVWININNLENEEFLKQHNIEYIIEGKEKNIIPIGLIDFEGRGKYTYSELNVWNQDDVNLYRVNQILENIDRAIAIKYETIKFLRRLGNDRDPKIEEIELL